MGKEQNQKKETKKKAQKTMKEKKVAKLEKKRTANIHKLWIQCVNATEDKPDQIACKIAVHLGLPM